MKKCISLLIVITLLVGCGEMPPQPTSNSAEKVNNLQPLTDGYGASTITTSKKNGIIYEASPNMTGFVVKAIDVNSKLRSHLCNRTECLHKDESCTAWFKTNGGSVFFSDQMDKLFYIQTGSVIQELNDTVYVMNPNGENRQEIYQMKANERIQMGIIASEGENVYLSKSGVTDKKYLYTIEKINVKTKETSKIFESKSLIFIIGCFENSLIISQIEKGTGEEKIIIANIVDGSIEEIEKEQYIREAGRAEIFGDKEYIYIMYHQKDEAYSKLDKFNIKTKELTRVSEDLLNFYDASNAHGIHDGMLMISTFDVDTSALDEFGHYKRTGYLYGVNLNTSEIKYVSLPYYERETKTDYFVSITSVFKDGYIVSPETKEIPYPFITGTGDVVETMIGFPMYAYMSKEDYWNGVPNYLQIEDV